jgi:hypothetical protein
MRRGVLSKNSVRDPKKRKVYLLFINNKAQIKFFFYLTISRLIRKSFLMRQKDPYTLYLNT